jgi:hypothetical protein
VQHCKDLAYSPLRHFPSFLHITPKEEKDFVCAHKKCVFEKNKKEEEEEHEKFSPAKK